MRRPNRRNPHSLLQFHKLRAAREDIEADFARIEVLTKKATSAFVFLLTFLAFAVVTLLGVEDADFFLEERQTALPILDVLIPTTSFFYFAPLLILTLYANLHLQLVKLWKALAAAPAQYDGKPLAEHVHPWIVTDFALVFRPTAQAENRSLSWLTQIVGLGLAFVSAPVVLGAFWVRSMPKHDPCLTFGIGMLMTLLSVVIGIESWRRMKAELAERETPKAIPSVFVGVAAVLLFTMSWFRVVRPVTHYKPDWAFAENSWPLRLASADLEGIVFVPKPEGWRPYDTAKADYWPRWCTAHGNSLPDCTLIWEDKQKYDQPLLTQYETAWREHRKLEIDNLPNRSFQKIDWRSAGLAGAELQGADLGGAQLQGAVLLFAQLQGADLGSAELQEAVLLGAQLQGANLRGAELQGADLRGAEFSDTTDFSPAALRGAGLKSVDLSMLKLSQDRVNQSFGDSDVTLPEGIERPAHWREEGVPPLSWKEFQTAWRDWQTSIGFDPDDPATWDE